MYTLYLVRVTHWAAFLAVVIAFIEFLTRFFSTAFFMENDICDFWFLKLDLPDMRWHVC